MSTSTAPTNINSNSPASISVPITSTPYKSNPAFLYGTTVAFSILVVLCIIFLFGNKNTISNFNIILWAIIPVSIYIISTGLNLLGQWMACRSVDIVKGFTTALMTLVSIYSFLGLSHISAVRVPIGSIFASYFATKDELTSNTTLEKLELKYPILMGISVAYYLFWGTMFGQIVTSGFSAGCPIQ